MGEEVHADFHHLARKVSNWGRWGREDQRGALNLITPEVLKRAGAAVRQGKLFRLGLDFAFDGPQFRTGPVARLNPRLYMTKVGHVLAPAAGDYAASDDVIHMPTQCATQWDAFGHVQYGGKLYNGFDAAASITTEGACRCGIEHAASPGILSRGVLLDIARLKGVGRLAGDVIITPDDLDAACRAERVEVERGDIVLVRTGHIAWFTRDRNIAVFGAAQPGLSMHCALWLRDRDVAAVAADNSAVEQLPLSLFQPGEVPLPLHMLCLRDMGLILGELFDFEALAEDCASDGVYSFLLSAPALPIRGAVGSPINPLALR